MLLLVGLLSSKRIGAFDGSVGVPYFIRNRTHISWTRKTPHFFFFFFRSFLDLMIIFDTIFHLSNVDVDHETRKRGEPVF